MIKNQNPIWLTRGMTIFAVLLNVQIIIAAFTGYDNWLLFLAISIPLLIGAVYLAWQTNHSFRRFFIGHLRRPVRQVSFEYLSHTIYPNDIDESDLRVVLGNDQCSQPYNACILNFELNSNIFPQGPLKRLPKEERLDHLKESRVEGLNIYCLAEGGIVWQIRPDYLGCKSDNGNFNSKKFKQIAGRPEVKMIELVLSSAFKPVYPVKSILNIAESSDGSIVHTGFQGSSYTTFREAEGMIHFLNSLRELSGGKPIGIRLTIKDKKEFYQICHAVRKTQISPDFIVIEGSSERARFNHSDLISYPKMPLYEALSFVSQTLEAYALDREIKLIAAGKIISAFDILKLLALGADAVCAQMPSYDHIKYSGNGWNKSSLSKSQNAHSLHDRLMKALIQIMKIGGFMSVSDITLSKFFSRLDVLHSKNIDGVNGPMLYVSSAKKVYSSKIKSYPMKEERRKRMM